MPISQAADPSKVQNRRPTLAAPVTIAKFWKNRQHIETVHATPSEYQGHCLISVRIYATGTDGIDRPTTKGVSMSVRKLPELARALAKAEAKARELGLILNDGAAE